MSSPRSPLPLVLAGLLALAAIWWADPLGGQPAGSPDRARAEALEVLAGEDPVPADEAGASARPERRAPSLSAGVQAAGGGATPRSATPRQASGPAGRVAVTTAGAGARKDRTWIGEVRSSVGSEPVAAATVTLRLGPELSEATTDEEGVFRIAWFSEQPGDLEIAHPSLVDLRTPALELEDDARFVLEPSGSLEGRLTDLPLGLEAGGQRVELWQMSNKRGRDWPAIGVEVGAEGTFLFEDLDPGEYALCAFGDTLAGRYESGVLVPSGGRVRQDLALPEGARVLGQLVGAPGQPTPPLEGARIEVTSRDRELPRVLAEARQSEVLADADGSFELAGLAPGPYRLTVTTAWGAHQTKGIDVERSGELLEVELEVAPPASVAGRVVDSEGAPVPDLLVLAHRRKADLDLDELMAEGYEGEARQARTDGDGAFFLEEVPAEQQIVVLVPPSQGVLPVWSESLVLEPGEARSGIELRLPAGTYVEGRVERASATGSIGAHLAGALVQARMTQAGREVLLLAATTDEDGRYRLGPLLPRQTRLGVSLEGYLPGSETIELLEGVEHQVDFQLQPAWTLRGRVVDEDGAGVGRLRLTASVQDLDRPKNQRRERTELDPPDRMTHTDEFGRFMLQELPPADWILTPRGGTHDLIERTPRYADQALVEAGGELELVVRRKAVSERATLDLEVLSVATGQPPEDLVVGGVRGAQVTIDGGKVHVTGLPPEPLRIGLAAAGCASTYLDLELYEGLDLDLGLVLLEPGATVVVEVDGKDGKALDKAKVRLLPLAPEQGGPVAAGGHVGPEPAPRLSLEHRGGGRFRIEGVPHGAFRLKVTAPGHRTYTKLLDVDRDRLTNRLELKPKTKG